MTASVLVVDDEAMIRELYEAWLGGSHDVRMAEGGEAALSALEEPADVVLLDRRMPGMRGDEVVERIRERGLEAAVVMVSAVDPEVGVLELPFDDYLVKPAEADDLEAAVTRGLARLELEGAEREYARVLAKLGLLEATGVEDARARLSDRRAELRAALGDRADELEARAAAGELVLNVPPAVEDEE